MLLRKKRKKKKGKAKDLFDSIKENKLKLRFLKKDRTAFTKMAIGLGTTVPVNISKTGVNTQMYPVTLSVSQVKTSAERTKI